MTRAVLLGTGTPNADPDRSGPCVAIVVDNHPYLVDCGPGLVRRAEAAKRAGIAGLAPSKLDRLFVTHLHSDHTAGFPDLILTPWTLGRKQALKIFGPSGVSRMTEHLLAAYSADIELRRTGLEPANALGHCAEAIEIEAGVIYRDERLEVEAFPVDHGDWPAFGYKFVSADRTIVVSGDTAPTRSLVEASRGCDLLIHEVQSTAGLSARTEDWRKYHSRMHTTTTELAAMANEIEPGLLVLYHQLDHGVGEAKLMRELRRDYAGEVHSGSDLDVL